MSNAAAEFEAIQTVHGALEPLNEDARARVLAYIASLLRIDAPVAGGQSVSTEDDTNGNEGTGFEEDTRQTPLFSSFAELYAAADPKANGEKALVAGYWLQVCEGAQSFTAFAANKALTDLGHKILHITDAINSMKNQKPMLILQLKKGGTTRQARKLYKVSQAGIDRVEEMARG